MQENFKSTGSSDVWCLYGVNATNSKKAIEQEREETIVKKCVEVEKTKIKVQAKDLVLIAIE